MTETTEIIEAPQTREEIREEKRKARALALAIQVDTFCYAIQQGKTLTEAYRETYPDKAQKWTAASLQNSAHIFAKHTDVLARLVELKALSAESHQVSVQSLSNELQEAFSLAKLTGNSSAMVQAALGKAKIHGIGQDIKVGLTDDLMALIMKELPDTTGLPVIEHDSV